MPQQEIGSVPSPYQPVDNSEDPNPFTNPNFYKILASFAEALAPDEFGGRLGKSASGLIEGKAAATATSAREERQEAFNKALLDALSGKDPLTAKGEPGISSIRRDATGEVSVSYTPPGTKTYGTSNTVRDPNAQFVTPQSTTPTDGGVQPPPVLGSPQIPLTQPAVPTPVQGRSSSRSGLGSETQISAILPFYYAPKV